MSRRTQLLVCIVFLVAIAVPGTLSATGLAHGRAIENRPLAPRPSLSPRALLDADTYAQLSTYLTDRLPWRDHAVEAREEVSRSLFDESASTQVVAGRDGWLFLARTVRAPCLAEDEVRRVGAGLTGLADVLTAAGKQFRLMVVPEKETVYPQHLHDRDRRGSCIAENGERLRAEVGRTGLRPGYSSVLDRSRVEPDLFYRTDSHWGDRGALSGARDVVESLQPGLFDAGAYGTHPGQDAHSGDLLLLTGTPGREIADAIRIDRPAIRVLATTDGGGGPPSREVPIQREQRAGGALVPGRVLVSHDSSGFALRPLVAPWFADATWLTMGDEFDPRPWGRELRDADTVVIVMVERNLTTLPHTLLEAARAALE